MSEEFFCNKYTIFLLTFFSPMIIKIVGEVSPSFLFILGTLPFWYKYLDWEDDNFRYMMRLFFLLLGVQVVWACFSDTGIILQVKGIAIVVSGMLFFMYYYMVYTYDRDVVKWGALAGFLASFVFISGLAEMAGGSFGMWKFQIFPRLVTLCTLLYLWLWDYEPLKRIIPYLFIIIGMVGLATGARSSGLAPFITGCCYVAVTRGTEIDLSSVKKYLLIGAVGIYAAYALLYVPNVMNGNITGGNTQQLKKAENPYNPLNLLMVGRSDSVVPFLAFLDKPLTGWGYDSKDPNYKYHKLRDQLASGDKGIDSGGENGILFIPGHSGWGYLSCSYGIVGFLIIFFMLKRPFSLTFDSLMAPDRYLLLRIYTSIGFLWNILFSPLPHFKTSPASLAMLIVFSIIAMEEEGIEVEED